ncbi:SusC/RagA family TonB-linked outer membrane protein [Rhodohalobacter sp. SW132]|uniref:SusC/RagA family TonB-linked outer membrane protein n=1 Tax=Rhodohalobacter sp. SW132 TaxID=2293433 RepID=UPI000E26432A|nr:SusC/RagA family TonB-linked outer membrane protein [Rhodohalobacter sp. SW132]REL29108.1 SusC/RagA family TonB-linked outer membrane protein [Rhodohalobacter sp. SW132]
MFKKLLTVITMVLLTAQVANAQSIAGQVTDATTGEFLPGVNVLIQQLQRGDATDLDGQFQIDNVPSGTYTLIVTYIGYERYQTTVEIADSDIAVDIELTPSLAALDDVVVTAFGIQRDRRALGYGVAEVSADQIVDRNQPDLSRALTGQLSGVDVGATGGVTGSGTDIVIRGFSTLTGSNAPLIVVDGVRFDGDRNETDSWAQGGGAQTTPNRLLDLDPQNIADVTVLKGLSATVLYGEQGRNGVILIETKSGSFRDTAPGFQISFDQSVYATQISSRPDYQNTYGIGFDQNFGWFFSNWGPRFDTDDPRLFGGQFRGFDDDGTVLTGHPLGNHGATADAFPQLAGTNYRYEPRQNPVDAFFRTGLASTSNLSIAGGIDDLRVNVSYSRTGEEGFTPNNDLTRNSFSVGAQYRVTDRFTASTSFNMSLTDINSPPSAAGGGSGPASATGTTSVFGDVFYTPRSIDLNIPFENPVTGGSAYYRAGNDIPHPSWTANNSGVTNSTDRYYGRTQLTVDVTDEVAVSYRLGYDSYTENRSYWQNPGGVRPDFLLDGFYQTIEQQRTSWDHSLNLNFAYQLTQDFSFDGIVGGQFETSKSERQGMESENMIVRGFFNHSNFIDQSAVNSFGDNNFQRLVERQTAGIFANLTLGYQDFVYLNLAGRNDWFSTLEPDNRSIFYPSASLSYILTDHIDLESDFLTYVKLYAGVGTSAGSPDAYSTRNTLGTNVRGFVNRDGNVITRNSTSSFLGNMDLKPELHTEYEIGTDLRFLNGRVGLEAMYFTRNTTDLITQAPIDPATGYTSTLVNIGEINNQGLELTLRATPIARSLQWDVRGNFYTSKSEVRELGADLERIQVGGGFTDRGNFAIPGEPFMIMLGSTIVRNEDGVPLIGPTGNYIIEDDIDIIGDPNPDYTLSVSNTFRYRGASLSFQVDYQEGGAMFSTWISSLMARGLTTDTDRVNRNNTFILPGISSETGEENTVQISVSDVFFDNFGFGADELRVYDMTHVRLRQVSLSYDLPVNVVDRSPFDRVTFSITGDNLWMHAFNVPQGSGFDPEVNSIGGNSRGFEYFTGPAARRFGGSVRIQF